MYKFIVKPQISVVILQVLLLYTLILYHLSHLSKNAMWNISVFNHLQCISAQTHSVVYTDCLAHPETDTVHNFTFFPYKINPCSLLPVIIRTYLINYAASKSLFWQSHPHAPD